MDHDDGVYESYHDRGNDAGTDCGQFSNLCRNSDSGTSGSGCGNLGMYFPILYHCIGIGIHISALPWRLCDGKYFRQSSPSGSGADRAGLSMLLAAVLPEVNGERMIQWGSLVLFSAAFIALRKWKLNPILVMWVCGGVSLAVKLIEYHL